MTNEPLKEEEAEVETSWLWWTDYEGESYSPHVMLYGPNGKMLGNGVAIALELSHLEAEVKALKPLAKLARELRKRGEFSHSWGKGIKDDDDYIAPCRRLYSDHTGTKSEDCTCGLDALLAATDSALNPQGEQANP